MIGFRWYSVDTVDKATRHAERHLQALQFVETVFGRSPDSPFVLAFKEYGTRFDIGALLTISEQHLAALTVRNPFEWIPGEPATLAIDAEDRNLVRSLQYFAGYRCQSNKPIDWKSSTPVTADEFDNFCASILNRSVNLEPTTGFTLSSYSTSCFDRLASEFPVFSDDLLFEDWFREFRRVGRLHGFENLFDSLFVPVGTHATELFTSQQEFLFAVLSAKLTTIPSKRILGSFADRHDAQSLLVSLNEYFSETTPTAIDGKAAAMDDKADELQEETIACIILNDRDYFTANVSTSSSFVESFESDGVGARCSFVPNDVSSFRKEASGLLPKPSHVAKHSTDTDVATLLQPDPDPHNGFDFRPFVDDHLMPPDILDNTGIHQPSQPIGLACTHGPQIPRTQPKWDPWIHHPAVSDTPSNFKREQFEDDPTLFDDTLSDGTPTIPCNLRKLILPSHKVVDNNKAKVNLQLSTCYRGRKKSFECRPHRCVEDCVDAANVSPSAACGRAKFPTWRLLRAAERVLKSVKLIRKGYSSTPQQSHEETICFSNNDDDPLDCDSKLNSVITNSGNESTSTDVSHCSCAFPPLFDDANQHVAPIGGERVTAAATPPNLFKFCEDRFATVAIRHNMDSSRRVKERPTKEIPLPPPFSPELIDPFEKEQSKLGTTTLPRLSCTWTRPSLQKRHTLPRLSCTWIRPSLQKRNTKHNIKVDNTKHLDETNNVSCSVVSSDIVFRRAADHDRDHDHSWGDGTIYCHPLGSDIAQLTKVDCRSKGLSNDLLPCLGTTPNVEIRDGICHGHGVACKQHASAQGFVLDYNWQDAGEHGTHPSDDILASKSSSIVRTNKSIDCKSNPCTWLMEAHGEDVFDFIHLADIDGMPTGPTEMDKSVLVSQFDSKINNVCTIPLCLPVATNVVASNCNTLPYAPFKYRDAGSLCRVCTNVA